MPRNLVLVSVSETPIIMNSEFFVINSKLLHNYRLENVIIIITFAHVFCSYFSIVLNVAAGKAPMQISTEGAGIPQKAIDGSTSAFYTPETCSLTKAERVPWWYVNLLEPYMVQLVRLDFGKSCCGKLIFCF